MEYYYYYCYYCCCHFSAFNLARLFLYDIPESPAAKSPVSFFFMMKFTLN